MATENILMDAVTAGGDRQALHEKIRVHSMEAARNVKENGRLNDLLERIAGDSSFGMSKEDLEKLMDPKKFIGCAPEQTDVFLMEIADPLLKENKKLIGMDSEVRV